MPRLPPTFEPDETPDQSSPYALEERLRTDLEFRAVCLFWVNFYDEMDRNREDVSPLVKGFVDGLYQGVNLNDQTTDLAYYSLR